MYTNFERNPRRVSIFHVDLTRNDPYAMICMHSTLWGGLVTMALNVFGALGLSGFNLLG